MNICSHGIVSLAAFAVAFSSIVIRHGDTDNDSRHERELSGRSGALEALDFFAASRTYPDRDYPSDKYYSAYRLSALGGLKSGKSADVITQWKSIGPNNLSGRMISVAVDPLHPATVYAGSASGGLWRSETGGLGADWQRIPTGYPVLGVGAIAINPSNPDELYIGTGEVYRLQVALGGLVIRTTRGSFGIGILKSTDRGASWTKSLDWTTQQQRGIEAIRLNPLNPSTLFAASSVGLYKSTNAGASWSLNLFSYMGEDILINPRDTNKMLYSTGNFGQNAYVHRTTDGGTTWNPVNDLPPFTGKTLLAMFEGNPDVVYADVADSTTGVGSMWKSSDFGLNWTMIQNGSPIYQVQGWYSHFIAAHPTDPNILFHASVNMEKSTDGGLTYTGAGSGGYSDNHACAIDPSDPDIIYVANDDGIYRSTDFGSTFTYASVNLVTGQFYNGFSNSNSDSLVAIGQVQDHIPGYLYLGSTSWARSATDEVGWTAVDQSDDHNMYAISRNGGGVYKSTNRGASFSFKTGFPAAGAWNSPLVLSSSNTDVLYAGTTRIYKSTNGATSFSATNGNNVIDGNPALSMAMSSTNPDTVYAGMAPLVTRAHVYRTINGGSSWTDITGTLPDRYPLDLAVDPADSRTVYATFGGFGGGHLFRSSDAGATWTDLTGALPDVPTGAILVDPLQSQRLYVGNDIGVYVSTDGGQHWNSFSDGLPEAVLISDLSMTNSNRTLRATTHGNGIFERRVDQTLPDLALGSPNGGELIEAGSTKTISWGSGLIGTILIEFSTDNGLTWGTVADHVAAAPGTFSWSVPYSLTTQGLIRITSDSDAGLKDASNAPFTIFFNGNLVPVTHGWFLSSVPVIPADFSSSALFPTHIGAMFDYEDGYKPQTVLDVTKGYWAKFPSDQIVPIAGSAYSSNTIPVVPGWNLIGALSTPVPTSQVSQSSPGLLTSGFVGFRGRYEFTATLTPGSGYWVKAADSGSITILSSLIQKPDAGSPYADLKDFGRLTVTDARGNSQTLFAEANAPAGVLERYSLPPSPPEESFDIRFSTGRLSESIASDTRTGISARGAEYPLTIRWEPASLGAGITVGRGDRAVETIRGEGSAVVPEETSGALWISAGAPESHDIPTEAGLVQNYPNPFNPSTEITFRVSERARTTVEVFDITGKNVARLLDEPREPGTYSIRWDAGNAPSGIYICRMRAGGSGSEIKMLLVK